MHRTEYIQALPQLILLLLDDLVLDEEEGEQGRDEEVEGSDSRNDIVVIDIFILPNRVLRVTILHLLGSLSDVLVEGVAEQRVIDQRL